MLSPQFVTALCGNPIPTWVDITRPCQTILIDVFIFSTNQKESFPQKVKVDLVTFDATPITAIFIVTEESLNGTSSFSVIAGTGTRAQLV